MKKLWTELMRMIWSKDILHTTQTSLHLQASMILFMLTHGNLDTDEVADTAEVVGTDKVVTTGEVDTINGTDIIDGVVNTVDVSDTDDEWTDDIRTEDVEPSVILIPVITAEWLVKQEYKFAHSHAYSVKLLPAGMLSVQWIKFNWSLGGIR